MWPFSIGETLLLCTTVFTGIVSIITAWRATVVQRSVDATEKKVDIVHEATNSRLSRIDAELQTTKEALHKALSLLAAQEKG